ncbi:MAG: hypothetical protein Fur0032_04640 [Terrimicrobiaceae bacterium]
MDEALRNGVDFLRAWLRPPRTTKRLAVAAGFAAGFPAWEAAVWAGLVLDDVVYKDYRNVRVEEPVFIAGNFRSGTTFLHRLMGLDRELFRTMELWEILLCPSVSSRKIVRAVHGAQLCIGNPLGRWLGTMDQAVGSNRAIHETGIRQPEEDDYLQLHRFSALTVGLASGLTGLAAPYVRFDDCIAREDRIRTMKFYRSCIQRHLFANPGGTHYLAKNPALTPKLASVFAEFPDARVIVLVRHPFDMLASLTSMMQVTWKAVGVELPDSQLADFLRNLAGHWYRYPIFLAEKGFRIHFVRYSDLVRDPLKEIRRIYEAADLPWRDGFEATLRDHLAASEKFQSRHNYDAAQLGIQRDSIERDFHDVIDRFQLVTGE